MLEPFIRKLKYGAGLTPEDADNLRDAVKRQRRYRAGEDVSAQGDVPKDVHVLLRGWGCRYKMLENGRRQIMAIFVTGDMSDLHVQVLKEMDHGISVLTDATVAEIAPERINALTRNSRINLALNWATLADEGTLREWLVNIGQRPADKRVAHLICELFTRLRAVGFAHVDGFDMLLTQTQLADVTGMTPVHVNRTLAALRDERLVDTHGRRVIIPDFDRLADFSGFDPSYLHLGGTQRDATI